MFFELHSENRIGYKELTDADIGRKPTSHQTHIGLFDDVLTFFPSSVELEDAMVIYNDKVEIMSVSFDRIENPNQSFRSPKIRTGGSGAVSVVSFIRDKVKNSSLQTRWFLFWFGLKSGQPVFFFFDNTSSTYKDITSLGIKLDPKVKARIGSGDPHFYEILQYLQNVVNKNGFETTKELELVAQGAVPTKRNYRSYDIDRANLLFRNLGREGEELVDKYFSEQLSNQYIQSYLWVNKESESGKPYDFCVEKNNGDIIYIDVKNTHYDFEQKMIFSSQEIKFITELQNKYQIYRVYGDVGRKFLRICNNARPLFATIYNKICTLEKDICNIAEIETIKMAILPSHSDLTFDREIPLM